MYQKSLALILTLTISTLFISNLFSQTPKASIERTADFHIAQQNNRCYFEPVTPPLQQIAGAPPAYYDYYWEFGDGSFSFEQSPNHFYPSSGEYEVQMIATGKYDNGKAPRRRRRRATIDTTVVVASVEPEINVLQNEWDAIGLKAVRSARPEEELTCILSYQNNLSISQNGRLYFFYNEKRYDQAHFTFSEARTHYGEEMEQTEEETLGLLAPESGASYDYWAGAGEGINYRQIAIPEEDGQSLLDDAKIKYRNHRSWRFQGINPGEARNLFISLDATPEMLADTNAMITLEALYLTDDGQVADLFTLELEIVASHDPNVMLVSDTRMGFRGVKRKALNYKVRFQNDGEGPASKIEVSCDVPKGLSLEKLDVLDYYPKCPICPEQEVNWSCLDTTLRDDKLIFTFRNVYLPGGKQEGLSDRDSTRGFIKYRLRTGKGIKKRPLSSQASIVFDANPPIRTNRPKTRFKPGFSPGLIVARHFLPGEPDPSYTAVGLSLSPFKPSRFYLQAEAYAGLTRETQQRFDPIEEMTTEITDFIDPTAPFPVLIDSFTRTTRELNTRAFSIEVVPVSIRYNLNDWFGFGAGSILQIDFEDLTENIVRQTARQVYSCRELDPNTPRERCEPLPQFSSTNTAESSNQSQETRFNFKLFADVQLGAVRRGPLLGLRGVLPFQEGADPYFSVYLNFKL